MKPLLLILKMIRFEHTVFALPFAYLGAFLAARGLPDWRSLLWITVAMFAARSAAMAFNRLADRRIDRHNPRTRERELPAGRLSVAAVVIFVIAGSLLFILAARQLNPLALKLSLPALLVVFAYSYTKRFTRLSHLVLGLGLSIAPVGGWIGVRGSFDPEILLLAGAVALWVAGFDIIYACQDVEVDRAQGLHSIPAALGVRRALLVSSSCHVLMVLLLLGAWLVFDLTLLSWLGLGLVALALFYEHRLIGPDDLSRVNAAFFAVNGFISVALFLTVGLDLCLFV